MIYNNVVREYEKSVYGEAVITQVDEGNFVLESLYKEQEVYCSLLENCIDSNEREILEAKYEVIQEAIGVAFITAIVAIIGAIIALFVMITKILNKGSSQLESKIDKCVKDFKKIDPNKIIEDSKKIAQQLNEEIKNKCTGEIKVVNDAHLDIEKVFTVEDFNKFKNTIEEYIRALKSNGNNQDDIVARITDGILTLDNNMNQISEKLSLIPDGFFGPKFTSKISIEVIPSKQIIEEYLSYINKVPSPINGLEPYKLKQEVQSIKDVLKEIDRIQPILSKLQKDFEQIKNDINISKDAAEQLRMDNQTFFSAVYNTLKVLKNHYTALSHIEMEVINVYNTGVVVYENYINKCMNELTDALKSL